MQYLELIKDLSSHLQLPEIVTDELQRFALLFDEMYLLFSPELVETGEENIKVSAVLGQLPDDEGQAIIYYEELLCANLLGHGTACAYLGVNASGEISLMANWPLQNTSFSMFGDLLENFVSHVEHWKNQLEKMQSKELEINSLNAFDTMRA